jgi:hypothetical protein
MAETAGEALQSGGVYTMMSHFGLASRKRACVVKATAVRRASEY